jgi:G3E family GTPase
MTAKTDVFLVTGFLGSGKTTFLNRIMAAFPRDRKLMVLMNEFGEVGIDGTLIQGEDFDLLEINKGSIFCVCVKTDFIRGLYDIALKIRPDVLIIESTGVANPTDLKRDLQLPIFGNRFRLSEQFCLIDAINFLDVYETYASIEKQIKSSTVFIINKSDLANESKRNRIKEIIRRHHPSLVFFETTYAVIPLSGFLNTSEAGAPCDSPLDSASPQGDLDLVIEQLLMDPVSEVVPPDRLVSKVYEWKGSDVQEISKILGELPRPLIRGKGFLRDKNGAYYFSLVMGEIKLEHKEISGKAAGLVNRLVFVGEPETMDDLERKWRDFSADSEEPGLAGAHEVK